MITHQIKRAALLGLIICAFAPAAYSANRLQFFFPKDNDIFNTTDDEIVVKPIFWSPEADVQWVLFNPGGQALLLPNNYPSDEVVTVLRRALQAWNNVTGSAFDFNTSIQRWDSGAVDPPLPREAELDGHNIITFRSQLLGGAGNDVAAASIFFMERAVSGGDAENLFSDAVENTELVSSDLNGDGVADIDLENRSYAQGEIIEVDLLFNSSLIYRNWPQNINDVPSNQVSQIPNSLDIQAIATHVLGHAMGLAHTSIVESTMFPFDLGIDVGYSFNPYKIRVPGFDDQMAARLAYPATTAATGEIRGQLFDGVFVAEQPPGSVLDPTNRATMQELLMVQVPVYLGRPASAFPSGAHPDNIGSAGGTIRLMAQVLTGQSLKYPAGAGGVNSLEPARTDSPNIDFLSTDSRLQIDSKFRFTGLPAATNYVVYTSFNRFEAVSNELIPISSPYNFLATHEEDFFPEFYGGATCRADYVDGFEDDVVDVPDFIPVTAGTVANGIDIITNVSFPTPCPTPTPASTPTERGNNGEILEVAVPRLAPTNIYIPIAIRARNTGTTTWTAEGNYIIATVEDDCLTFPQRIQMEPGVSVAPGQEYWFHGTAFTPGSTATCHPVFQLGVSYIEAFGYPVSATMDAGSSAAVNFDSDPNGWYGGVAAGTGLTYVAPEGLCMEVPLTGDNITVWVSPEHYMDLVDNSVYRVRLSMTTDQAAVDAIPFWNLTHDNYTAAGLGNTFGGEAWFLDNTGGADGIGRSNGRTTFDVYITPNSVITPQWRGLLADGSLGAFNTVHDSFNDIRLILRVLDLGSAGINANIDLGTICMGSLSIARYLVPNVLLIDVLYNTPLTNATHGAHTFDQNPLYAEIDDGSHVATYGIGTFSDRATLIPAVDLHPPDQLYSIASLYPVTWSDNTLYRVASQIQLRDDATGVDPLDAIGIIVDTPTIELGQVAITLRGHAPNNMFRSASPRTAATAGGAQTYVSYFYSQNATDFSVSGLNRLRPMVDLFNAPTLYGAGTGGDPLQVLNLEMDRMVAPF